jgi:hypothetical protein
MSRDENFVTGCVTRESMAEKSLIAYFARIFVPDPNSSACLLDSTYSAAANTRSSSGVVSFE